MSPEEKVARSAADEDQKGHRGPEPETRVSVGSGMASQGRAVSPGRTKVFPDPKFSVDVMADISASNLLSCGFEVKAGIDSGLKVWHWL